jgi:hypothetical protein
VTAVIDRAMQGCRESTLQHLKLPPGENVQIEYVTDKPWNAYSLYRGKFQSLIRINTDFPLTVDRALQLMCHEGYPGHHAYNTLVNARLVEQEHRMELMVQPTFSPQSLASEALATYAAEVAFPGEERLRFERDVLFPLTGIDPVSAPLYVRINRLLDELDRAQPGIARDYLDGGLEWVRAASALGDQALMADTEATLKYLNEYRTYMLTYTVGKDIVKNCFARQAPADRWALFGQLMLGQVLLRECGTANATH